MILNIYKVEVWGTCRRGHSYQYSSHFPPHTHPLPISHQLVTLPESNFSYIMLISASSAVDGKYPKNLTPHESPISGRGGSNHPLHLSYWPHFWPYFPGYVMDGVRVKDAHKSFGSIILSPLRSLVRVV